MMMHFVTFLVAAGASAYLTRWVRDTAIARNWVDSNQSSRKVHSRPIPRLGGVAMVLGYVIAVFASMLAWPAAAAALSTGPIMTVVVGGGVCVALLGLADDFHNLRARHKLVVQVALALGAWALGIRVEWLGAPFGLPADLGLLSLPLTLLWVIGAINAVNLIDGLDGLAAGVALVAAGVNLALAMVAGDVASAVLMAALMGVVLGFLLYNFNPASIFMGDTGSMFLGFVLAVVSLRTSAQGTGAAAVLVPLVTLGLPVLDTLMAIGRRMARGRPVFSADKEHIHHRLMRRFELSHRDTVLVLYGVCLAFGAAAFSFAYVPAAPAAWVLAALAAGVCTFLNHLGTLDLRNMEQLAHSRSRNLALRRAVRQVVMQLGNARTLDEVWAGLHSAAPALGAADVSLRLRGSVESGHQDVRIAPSDLLRAECSRSAMVPVRYGVTVYGALRASWSDERAEIDRDEEIGLEEVAYALARAFGRLGTVSEVISPAVITQLEVQGAAVRRRRA